MMRRITKRSWLWITIATLMSFGFLAMIFNEAQMIEIASGFVLGTSLAVTLTWFPAAKASILSGDGEGKDVLKMAIFGTGFALFAHRIYTYAARWLGRPEWLVDSYLGALAPWGLGVALVMILLAPGTQEGNIPLRNYVWFVFAGVIGALFSGIAIGYSLVKIAQ